jgi:peptidoglycan/LPS O-acetylase OafA/YrhL
MEGLTKNLISIYVVTETIRASCEFYAFNTTLGISPPLTFLLSNFLQLTIATFCIFCRGRERSEKLKIKTIKDVLRYAVPAGLDLLSTFVYIIALPFTSPFILQAFMIAKVPATAILYHVLVQKQRNVLLWSSLIWLCLGLLISKIPPAPNTGPIPWVIAILAGCVIGMCSAASSISSEKLLKFGSFWESQLWLYLWATFFSILAYPIRRLFSTWATFRVETQPKNSYLTYIGMSVLVAVPTAAVGITEAVILRKRNNLAKLVGTAASVPTSAIVLSYASMPLRVAAITSWSTVGYFVTAVSLRLFHSHQGSRETDYNTPRTDDYQAIPLEDKTVDEGMAADDTEETQQAHEEQGDHCLTGSSQTSQNSEVATGDEMLPCQDTSRVSFRAICDATSFGLVSKVRSITIEKLASSALSLIIFLLPSFSPIRREQGNDRKVHPTAYLDGVRGVAAFCVVLYHVVSVYFKRTLFGWNGTSQNLFFQLPWIRLIISGHTMVALFFVVSGFSISYTPLKRIHSKDLAGFSTSLASSVFRRHLRLFLPCLVITFSDMLLVYTGVDQGRLRMPRASLSIQLEDWFNDFVDMCNPTRSIYIGDWVHLGSRYAGHLWTVPVEFRGSMVVYLLLCAGARMPAKIRIGLVTGLGFFWGYYTHWDLMLFLSGMVLADMRLMRTESTVQLGSSKGIQGGVTHTSVPTTITKRISIAKNSFWILNFLLASYILSIQGIAEYPHGGGDPGYVFLWSLTPFQYTNSVHWYRFWPAVGSIYLVFIIDNCPLLQRIFTLRFTQYLGFISFALYLIHVPVINTFAAMFLEKIWQITGYSTPARYWWGFCLAYIFVLLGMLWGADVFTRAVDEKCVKFSKWVFDKLVNANI